MNADTLCTAALEHGAEVAKGDVLEHNLHRLDRGDDANQLEHVLRV
jgi:hypothetical protein